MLEIQEYLKTHSLAQLKLEHGINSSWKFPIYKFSLNYDQIASKAGTMVNQCRGLILATHDARSLSSLDEIVGETIIMARPMDRFFNYGDPNAAVVDFEHPATCFFEKLDGTLCILYFDTIVGEWHVATRGVPEANIPLDGFLDLTFRKLFEKALSEMGLGSFEDFVDCIYPWTENTYCFELTSPMNRVVVDYKNTRLTLLAVRENLDGKNYILSEIVDLGVPHVQKHTVANIHELMEFVTSRNPTEHEGVVVCDHNFNRVKVKNAAYLAFNRARDIVGKSPRALLEIILLEKMDDVRPMLPEHIQLHATQMENSLRALVREIDQNYLECKGIADLDIVNSRKAFCIHAQANKYWLTPLINRFLGQSDSCMSYFKGQQNKKDGSFGDSFLDTVLAQLKYYTNNS